MNKVLFECMRAVFLVVACCKGLHSIGHLNRGSNRYQLLRGYGLRLAMKPHCTIGAAGRTRRPLVEMNE